MQLKPGFKQTEVGVIPKDWEVTPLSLITTYTNGKAHERCISALGKYIVVNSKFISTNGEVKKYSDVRFSPASKGEILMVMSDVPNGRAIARCFFVDCDDRYTVNQRICILRPLRVNGRLLTYKLDRNPYYLAFDDGVKQTNLRKSDVLACPLALPPTKAERDAIAEALGDADSLIETLEQLLTKKRCLKQGAMQELLTGTRRLSGFSGEWDSQAIEGLERAKLVRLSRGDVISKKDIVQSPGDYPIYSSSVAGGGIFGHYGHYMFNEELITWSIDGGGDFFYRPKHKFSVTNVCGFMRVDQQRLSYPFIAAQLQLLHSRQSFDYVLKAHPSVIRKAYELKLPSLPEQTAIATILADMDAEIAAIEENLSKTHQLKQGMMQELLTGRIRLV